MAQMSINDKRKSEKYGNSSQLINWILYSGATYHMTPEVSDLVPVSLEDKDKYIEFCGQTSRHGETKRTSKNKNVRR